ncbi:hypothetical protein GUJ93_ZPchr0012g22186 [Zizania palustris]|uniref:Uncharacterized protein n=1 Tax=Zizania palustris TaxID=103762 RepID=A0A8J6BXS9_ZIZPA|nr:hypothetical protein GUJ93_ZPchr0012g22186 [Zizania palustris]
MSFKAYIFYEGVLMSLMTDIIVHQYAGINGALRQQAHLPDKLDIQVQYLMYGLPRKQILKFLHNAAVILLVAAVVDATDK